MRIARIEVTPSIIGTWSTDIYICGCKFHCPECHNKALWDFNSPLGIEMTHGLLLSEIQKTKILSDCVTYLGGDWMFHTEDYITIAKGVHRLGMKNILYTGFDTVSKAVENVSDIILYGKYNPNDPDKKKQYKRSYRQL